MFLKFYYKFKFYSNIYYYYLKKYLYKNIYERFKSYIKFYE